MARHEQVIHHHAFQVPPPRSSTLSGTGARARVNSVRAAGVRGTIPSDILPADLAGCPDSEVRHTFRRALGEVRSRKDTSKFIILVRFLDLKFSHGVPQNYTSFKSTALALSQLDRLIRIKDHVGD